MRMPCKHGRYDAHTFHVDHELRVGPIGSDESRPCIAEDCDSSFAWVDCPGGRPPTVTEMVEWMRVEGAINYEAAWRSVGKEMRDRRIDRYVDDPDIWNEAVKALAGAAVDAALGGNE